jgi:hypothetical protein
MDKIKILFLVANPTDTSRLRLDEEIRAIDEERLATSKSKICNKISRTIAVYFLMFFEA